MESIANDVYSFVHSIAVVEGNRKFKSVYAGVSELGRLYGPYDLKKSIKYSRAIDVRQHECYTNSIVCSRIYENATYVQGFYSTGIIPLEHGWNVLETGEVIDLTSAKFNFDVQTYYGVPIHKTLVRKFLKAERFEYTTPLEWLLRNDYENLKKSLKV